MLQSSSEARFRLRLNNSLSFFFAARCKCVQVCAPPLLWMCAVELAAAPHRWNKTRLQWHVDVAFCYRAQARRYLAFAARRSSRNQGHRSLLRSSASLRAPAGGSVDHSAVRGSAALGKKTVLNDGLHTCRTSCYAKEHTHIHIIHKHTPRTIDLLSRTHATSTETPDTYP